MAKKSSATRILIYVIVGVVVLVGIFAVLRVTGVIGNRETGIAVETTEVSTRDVTQVVTASGKVQPEVEVIISPDVPGEIIELPINEGDQVEQGDLLARIRPDDYVAQLEQGEAGVLQSKATLAQRRADLLNAESELKRQQDLFNKAAISESEFQRADTQYEVAKAAYEAAEYAVQSSEARLREFQEQLRKTAIYAPMSGTISKLDVELGERVVGTSQMAGTEMMRVARLDQMELEVDVNENDVVNIAVADSAAIEIDAYPGRTFKGGVTEIANSARITAEGTQEQVTNFPVKVRIRDLHNVERASMAAGQGRGVEGEEVPLPESEAPNFRPGMSGTVDIFTRTVEDVIVVPIQAVTVRDINKLPKKNGTAGDEDGEATEAPEAASEEAPVAENAPGDAGQGPGGGAEGPQEDLRKVVFLFEDGKARMVEVETGISDDTHIEIKSGLTGDETVIIGPYRAVSRELEPDSDVRVETPGVRGPRALASTQ